MSNKASGPGFGKASPKFYDVEGSTHLNALCRSLFTIPDCLCLVTQDVGTLTLEAYHSSLFHFSLKSFQPNFKPVSLGLKRWNKFKILISKKFLVLLPITSIVLFFIIFCCESFLAPIRIECRDSAVWCCLRTAEYELRGIVTIWP